MSALVVVAIVVGVCLIAVVFMYNALVGKRNQVENAFGGIDVQLKKRYDLIPNLVNAVKQFMEHEKGILEEITRLRTEVMKPSVSQDEKIKLDNQLSKALGGIMVAVENYPDLKSNENFLQLQGSLNEVESQIAASRRSFNAAVTDFNNSIEMFPSSIIAGAFNFKRKEVFVAPEAERKNVNVGELFN